MLDAIHRLEEILINYHSRLISIPEKNASEKPAPGKWSKKELLGHLIDSASNNHQRFVRMQLENNLSLPQYAQDEWVKTQRYQNLPWIEIVTFWKAYNHHLIHVLKNMDETKVGNTARFPEYGVKTLQFIIDDYVDHMQHHLKKMFNE